MKPKAIAPGPDSPGVSFDEQGRLQCEHPDWRDAYDRLLRLRYDPGYLSLVAEGRYEEAIEARRAAIDAAARPSATSTPGQAPVVC